MSTPYGEHPLRRPFEFWVIGVAFAIVGASILLTAGATAPGYLNPSPAPGAPPAPPGWVTYAYGTFCLLGGLATIAGLFQVWRARRPDQAIAARSYMAAGLVLVGVVSATYAAEFMFGRLANPKSSLVLAVFAGLAIATWWRAGTYLRDNRRTSRLTTRLARDAANGK